MCVFSLKLNWFRFENVVIAIAAYGTHTHGTTPFHFTHIPYTLCALYEACIYMTEFLFITSKSKRTTTALLKMELEEAVASQIV